MMKAKTAFKSIFLKTAATFLTFYFIAAIVFTAIYYKAKVDENNAKFDNMESVLQERISRDVLDNEYERLSDGRKGYWEDDTNSLNKDINYLTSLNSEISYFTSAFSKEMFSKADLYDENFNVIAKSRNMLVITEDESEKSKTDHCNVNRYIDLDKYLSEDQQIEVFKVYNQKSKSKEYFIKVQGYANGNEIIPEVLEIYESTLDGPVNPDEGIERGEKIKTYNFNVEGVDGLRKINIADNFDPNWEIHYNSDTYSSNNNNYLYKKIFRRYNNFKKYKEEEIRSIMDENGYIYARNNINKAFGKINYDYINTLNINDHKYYINLQADYYPWEDVLPKAIPLYIVSFSIVIAVVIILSKGLYKTYEKQVVLEKNRRELTSAIAHELKTPLGIIRTYGEGLKEKIAEDKRDYYLDVIIDETYKMDKIVLEMLDLSKMEAKAYELRKEEFCINSLVEVILKKNEKLFNDRSLHINYLTDKEYYINADYALIERVINNLLSNAIYHTEENKEINITLKNQIFNIENEGEHIPKDKINLIWDIFYRGDNSRVRSQRRTGIGLAIVKNIFQLHNIEFGVENTNLGVKFWFKLL
ncbi:sensor histidine kinase [Clostridium beijerinckii]|uniref:sensor histidine kinase n=1 Tax=Clostridium beijerinckii TaxID=1520 RepID=UPI001FA6D8EF|nr:HAMP domain-containing sensor histidine kinase [Clostridium beijerinckii]